MIRTAIAGGLAASLLASVAPAAQAQSLGGLGNLFNCGNQTRNDTAGALIGGVLGGLAGAGVAENDAIGGILGAAVGAAAGNWIGCRMGTNERASLESATMQALEEGRSTTWSDSRTGASARINVYADTSTQQYGYSSGGYNAPRYDTARYGDWMSPSQLSFAGRVSRVGGYETVAPRQRAVTQTFIRTAPSLSASTNGRLMRGEEFQAMAKVSGQPWILVGRNGMGVGYVPQDAVAPAVETVTSGGYGFTLPRTAIRLNSGVGWANAYESSPSRYSVASNAYIRSTPSTSARSVGMVYRGDEVEAIAKVQGSPWVLVGRDGYGVGYVHETMLRPLDTAYAPTYASAPQAANCRIVEQVVTSRDFATQTQRYRACRDASGRWNMTAA